MIVRCDEFRLAQAKRVIAPYKHKGSRPESEIPFSFLIPSVKHLLCPFASHFPSQHVRISHAPGAMLPERVSPSPP